MKTLGWVVLAVLCALILFPNEVGGLFNNVTDLSQRSGPVFNIDWSFMKQIFQPVVEVQAPPVYNYVNIPQQPDQAVGGVSGNDEALERMKQLLESQQKQLQEIQKRLEPTPTPTPGPGLLDFLGDILP